MKSGCITITRDVLIKYCATCQLDNVRFVNLQNLGLQSINRLQYFCPNVQVLFLYGNAIQEIHATILQLRHIWILDISQNKLQSLDGLDRFIVLGSLNLSKNNLSWKELRKISHITILGLYLFKNHRLDQDPQYRVHIVDLFPKVWFLDGIIITAEERKHVTLFFGQESLKLVNPVRRKSSRNQNFTPTVLKNVLYNGFHGIWTERFMKHFPLNSIQDSILDSRRIPFFFNSLLECYQLTPVANCNVHSEFLHGLTSLVETRKNFPENFNMLLLFILVYILFSLPQALIVECLVKTDLQKIHNLNCTQLFLTSSWKLLKFIASVLFASILVDRENGMKCGLYDKLFNAISLCIYDIFTEKSSMSNQSDYCCLLASEVLEPFCLIQQFFEHIGEDEGVSKLVVAATRDPYILKEINDIKLSSTGDKWAKYHEISALLLHKSVPNLIRSTLETSYYSSLDSDYRTAATSTHLINQSKFDVHLTYESNDVCTEDSYSIYQQNASIVRPGDFVCLHNDKLARVIAITAPDLALLSTTSKSVNEFIYIKTTRLAWDPIGRWIVRESMKTKFDDGSIYSDPSTTTFYISRPASSNCESSNIDNSEIPDNQVSDTLHCNSILNLDEHTNLDVVYKEVISSQQSAEELKQERNYIQLVINQMHHEISRELHNVSHNRESFNLNAKFRKAQCSLANLSNDNSQALPSIYYDFNKYRSKSCSTPRSLSKSSMTSRLSRPENIFPTSSEHTPQCWIEVACTNESSSPSICNLGIHMDSQTAIPFHKWSPTSTPGRLSHKPKKQSRKEKLSMKSEPLLCVIGNNATIEGDALSNVRTQL